MNKRLPTLALIALLLGQAGPALAAAPQSAEEILERIERERDQTDDKLYKQLTAFGDRQSLEMMQQAVKALTNENKLVWAYEAFQNYLGKAELEALSIEYLADEADSGKEANRRGAAAGLRKFGLAAEPELRVLVQKNKDEVVRAYAVGPLMPKLEEEGTPEALETLLDNARLTTSGSRKSILDHVNGFAGAGHDEVLVARLSDKDYDRLMKVLVVEALAARERESVVPALVKALKDKNPAVQYAVLVGLDKRGETAHVKELEKLVKSKDASVRRMAVVALAKIRGTEGKWWRTLLNMSEDKDPVLRQGAVVALAELRTPEALELLYGPLLNDPDRAVRAEALQYVGNLRRKDSISHLIGRVNAERGRTKQDLLTVLRLITGEDQGQTYERWKRWWEVEGEAFEVPPYEQALRSERERKQRVADGRSVVASFYGLEIVSDRVCFVLDTSGSMKAPTPSGETRVEVAKEELARVVGEYPAGDLFNLIFFSTDVYPWQDGLVSMSPKMKKEALSYVGRQQADGFTAVYDALLLAYEDTRIDTIVLLTDGTPFKGTIDDPAEIRAEVQRWNSTRHVRIHCISIGGDNPLLQELAKDTGGEYRAVR